MATFYGTTLSDVQSGMTARDRMDTERQMLAQRLFSQGMQANADRQERGRENEANRALQYFGLGQTRELETARRMDEATYRKGLLDIQAGRNTFEAQQVANQLEIAKINAKALTDAERIRAENAKVDPRLGVEAMRENARIDEINSLAEGAAAEANNLLARALQESRDASNEVVKKSGLFGAEGIFDFSSRATNLAENRGVSQAYRDTLARRISEIPASLGERAALVQFDPQSRRFVAQTRKPVAMPQRNGSNFFGQTFQPAELPAPPAATFFGGGAPTPLEPVAPSSPPVGAVTPRGFQVFRQGAPAAAPRTFPIVDNEPLPWLNSDDREMVNPAFMWNPRR